MPSAVADPQVAAAIQRASAALDDLARADAQPADITEAYAYTRELEAIGRRVKALQAAVVNTVQRSGVHKADGHASPKVMVRHAANLSPAEATRRDAAARVLRSMPLVAAAHAAGGIGACQVDRIARTLGNPRVRDAFVAQDPQVAVLAQRLPYVEFDAKLTDWERIEDQDDARQRAERAHRNRSHRISTDLDGGHHIEGHLGALQGIQVKATFDRYCQLEYEADWAEARERLGDAATATDLRRTDQQRSADAAAKAWAVANLALGAQPGGAPVVTNIMIDEESLDREIHHACGDDPGPDPRAATLLGDAVEDLDGDGPPAPRPNAFRCCTEDGAPLHPSEALAAALAGHVRRVVRRGDGVVLDLGRLQRLFKGPQRAAVMLSGQRCSWVGCLVPASQCQADHLDAFNGPRQGSTSPGNGAPLCGRHNRLKERGFALYRDDRGRMHVLRPDGTEIL